ncbi:hypothetical protein PF008_g5355 [Phytophthora fragariae]|uniref:Phenylalanine--tRNA ligase beta subunit B1 domain-containing protein n=1 Tax=Phytophthora fragariae TaxID=53985 RepID=A0A6G0S8K8_9STRA|nr:hypothetical protein PF008_g5355 [Phytophthora fragariae]
MPTVGSSGFAAMGQTNTDEVFDVLCFVFDFELDDITSEKQLKQREMQGQDKDHSDHSDAVRDEQFTQRHAQAGHDPGTLHLQRTYAAISAE